MRLAVPPKRSRSTLAEAPSAPYTLTVLTWIGLIALPCVIAYRSWTYWIFRKRRTADTSAADRLADTIQTVTDVY